MQSGRSIRPSHFVRDSRKLWDLYIRSYKKDKLPSEVLSISNELLKYCLDRAVMMFGEAIEDDIRERTKKDTKRGQSEAKVRLILNEWLSM